MRPDEPTSVGYVLALEEARRALDEQERAVAQLSTRAGLLISAAAVVTSFLGGPVLARGALDPAAWIAVVAFVTAAAAALAIVWPRRDLEFALHPASLIGNQLETPDREPATLDHLQRELPLHLGVSITRNEAAMARMMTTFNIGSVSFAIETVAWVVSIATGL